MSRSFYLNARHVRPGCAVAQTRTRSNTSRAATQLAGQSSARLKTGKNGERKSSNWGGWQMNESAQTDKRKAKQKQRVIFQL
jgi:hypothetical protein